ncbi:cell division protein FtsB [Bathymodiolus japonicus methanotrophic gill symbiont]|uniref:septum formation initiator family protein n=1 Tax=Bathymodiolus japonicus methanotrophic gill symbiont TaxID=113269 RepID=UPI001B5AB08A|nr:cell division protein FtsB [Bathymodiolus japonicus methanotrophic gill symbiont]
MLIVLIVLLQYRLWYGDAGYQQIQRYQQQLDQLQQQLAIKQLRNKALEAEVLDLRKGKEAIEETARHDLGLIKQDETFFQVIE